MIPVILAITGRSVCSANSYFDNYIMGRLACSANRYCDNNDNNAKVYM